MNPISLTWCPLSPTTPRSGAVIVFGRRDKSVAETPSSSWALAFAPFFLLDARRCCTRVPSFPRFPFLHSVLAVRSTAVDRRRRVIEVEEEKEVRWGKEGGGTHRVEA